jgi:predicted RNase H-like HicB family nuclease
MRYLVIFEHGDMNYSAYVPDLPVCVAVGDTLEETREEIANAMKFHIECLQEDGEIIPKPTSKLSDQISSDVTVEFVEVEIDNTESTKQSNLPFFTSIMSRFKRKQV